MRPQSKKKKPSLVEPRHDYHFKQQVSVQGFKVTLEYDRDALINLFEFFLIHHLLQYHEKKDSYTIWYEPAADAKSAPDSYVSVNLYLTDSSGKRVEEEELESVFPGWSKLDELLEEADEHISGYWWAKLGNFIEQHLREAIFVAEHESIPSEVYDELRELAFRYISTSQDIRRKPGRPLGSGRYFNTLSDFRRILEQVRQRLASQRRKPKKASPTQAEVYAEVVRIKGWKATSPRQLQRWMADFGLKWKALQEWLRDPSMTWGEMVKRQKSV